MAFGKHQTCWAIPNLTIDCVLVSVHGQLEADGCVMKFDDSNAQVAAPDLLASGDFVKVRLWLEGEDASINISLAEVRQVHNHWITVELLQVGQHERMRLKRFVESRTAEHIESSPRIDRLHIRA